MNWSGGKDSSLCLYKVLQNQRLQVECLLTSVNKAHNRISMHGVRKELLFAQAKNLNMPVRLLEIPENPSMEEYEQLMENEVKRFRDEGISHAIFGDIFLEDLRNYREKKLQPMGIQVHFPLWKVPTKALMEEFLTLGFKAIIVSVNEKYLDKSFCGRVIDDAFVKDIPPNIDICGENGEYHSFVFDGPIFSEPILFEKGEIVYRQYPAPKKDNEAGYQCGNEDEKQYGFYFCDLLPVDSAI